MNTSSPAACPARRCLCFALFAFAAAALPRLSAQSTTFDVNSDASLRAAISSAATGATILFTSNITLTADLPAVHTGVTINGAGFTLDGASAYRGFFVGAFSGSAQTALAVTIENLTIQHAVAQGGAGGTETVSGGGGAGLGGAIFVANQANVTANNLTLTNDSATGGNGGSGFGRAA